MAWLLLFPVVLIGGAAIVSAVFVRRSTLHITPTGVEIRNYPQAPRVVPLDQAERFVETERTGNFKSLRPATATLVLTDGSRVPVRSLRDDEGAFGVDALNARLNKLRLG